jgi:hypothetical protein
VPQSSAKLTAAPSSAKITAEERASLTKTVLTKFSELAESHSENSSWQIPTEGERFFFFFFFFFFF